MGCASRWLASAHKSLAIQDWPPLPFAARIQTATIGRTKGSAAFTPVIDRRIQRKKMTAGDDRTIAAHSKIADSSTGP